MPTPLEQLAHTIDEVCKIAKVGRSSTYEEIRSGRLIARKCGRRTIILATDLHAWLDRLPRIEPEAIGPADDQLAEAKTRRKPRR